MDSFDRPILHRQLAYAASGDNVNYYDVATLLSRFRGTPGELNCFVPLFGKEHVEIQAYGSRNGADIAGGETAVLHVLGFPQGIGVQDIVNPSAPNSPTRPRQLTFPRSLHKSTWTFTANVATKTTDYSPISGKYESGQRWFGAHGVAVPAGEDATPAWRSNYKIFNGNAANIVSSVILDVLAYPNILILIESFSANTLARLDVSVRPVG